MVPRDARVHPEQLVDWECEVRLGMEIFSVELVPVLLS